MQPNPVEPPIVIPPDPLSPPEHDDFWHRHSHALVLMILLAGLVAVYWLYGERIMGVLGDQDALKTFVVELGWWGPVALIGINIMQIIVAPIPGYFVYIVAGFLYGSLMGGIWGSIGMVLGGTLAMFVGRTLGRPLVLRIIGEHTLHRWEEATRSDSTLVWGALLLSPIGDAPFLLAGLSRVSYTKIIVLTIVTRVPAAFIAAAVGSGALHLTIAQVTLLVAALAVPVLLMARYQRRILASLERFIRRSNTV